MVPYYQFAKVLGIEVVGVEYSGYGAASGKPSSGNTYADLEAAYDHLTSIGIPPQRIVAYGQSVGSGPVASLAAKRQVGGIVLHSPLLSGIKVVDPQPDSCCRPSCVWHCFDFYPNDRWMKKLSCPVFIMHGQRDDIIPFYHGQRLYKACPKASRWPPYFPARAGHNDLVETDMQMYFGEVSSFLEDMKKIADGMKVVPGSQRVKAQGATMQVNGNTRDQASVEKAKAGEGQAEKAQKDEQELGVSESGRASFDAGEFLGVAPEPAPEPRAGPEDGRYEQLRRGLVPLLGDRGGQEDLPDAKEQPGRALGSL